MITHDRLPKTNRNEPENEPEKSFRIASVEKTNRKTKRAMLLKTLEDKNPTARPLATFPCRNSAPAGVPEPRPAWRGRSNFCCRMYRSIRAPEGRGGSKIPDSKLKSARTRKSERSGMMDEKRAVRKCVATDIRFFQSDNCNSFHQPMFAITQSQISQSCNENGAPPGHKHLPTHAGALYNHCLAGQLTVQTGEQ